MNRSRGAYDVIFESDDRIVGFLLAAPTVPAQSDAARLDETLRNADLPRVVDNLDAGMGYSRRLANGPDNGYAYTYPGYTRSPGGIFHPSGKLTQVQLPAAGAWTPSWITGSIRYKGRVYIITAGRHVLLLSTDGLSATVAGTFPQDIGAGTACVFNNLLYITTNGGMYYTDGVGWSVPATGVGRSQLVAVNWRPLGIPTDVLVGVSSEYGGNAIRWCPITADPMDPNAWSAPVRVGSDYQYSINQLLAAPRRVFMLRADGAYDMDELGVRAVNLTPWVREGIDYYNGGWGLTLGNGLYYSHSQGLAWVPTTGEAQLGPEWAHPGWGLPYEGPVRGHINTGTLQGGFAMVGMWEIGGSQSFICAGRKTSDTRSAAGPTHTWFGAEAIVPGLVQHMKVHTLAASGGPPQLLIGTLINQSPMEVAVYLQSLPTTGSPLQEMIWGGAFTPDDHASLFLPADPYDRPSSIKTMLQFDMLTERLNIGSDYLKLYARADEETTWADQGTADDGSYTQLAPIETVEGRYIHARIDAVGHPVLRSVALRAAIGVELREARQYTLLLAWDNALKGARSRETNDPERRLDDLKSMLGRVVTIDDASEGGPYRARVLQTFGGERRRIGGAARAGAHGDGAWAVTAQVVVSILDHPFRFDGPAVTSTFDTERTWV
jgi:hypothetical protein